MEPILQQLYHGNLDGVSNTTNGREEFSYYRKYFGQLLKDQAPALEPDFTMLMEDLTTYYLADTEEMFYRGFCLAVKLFSEGLAF